MEYRQVYYFLSKTISVLIIVCAINGVSAQSITRQSLSAIGGSSTGHDITVQMTVGQASIVHGSTSLSGTLRNGFIQPPSSYSSFKPLAINPLVYPNPCAGLFFIELEFAPDDVIRVTNLTGQIIFYKKITNASSKEEFDITHANAGIYLMTIERKSKTVSTTKLLLAK